MSASRVYTVGHSSHALEDFLRLLAQHEIEVLVDTRSVPRSGYSPHFNAAPLGEALEREGIEYRQWGAALGGKPASSRFYDDEGYVLYGEIAATDEFREAVECVASESKRSNIAVMCSEEDPADCHRRLLVGRVLCEMGIEVVHIRGDGSLAPEDDIEALEMAEPSQLSMLADPAEKAWKSTRSDSQRRRLSSSSGH